MNNKLTVTVIAMCMLLISTKMHTFPIVCTKIKMTGTGVIIILVGDCHAYSEEALIPFQRQIDSVNKTLLELTLKPSIHGGKTLFLLEDGNDHFSNTVPNGDTLPFLCKFAIDHPHIGNVEFSFADRRGLGIKTGEWFFNVLMRQVISEFTAGETLEDVEGYLSEALSLKDAFFSNIFPGLKREFRRKLRSLLGDRREIFENITAEAYLANLYKVRQEIQEVSRACCSKKQYDVLEGYSHNIITAENELRNFFTTFLYGDITEPYYIAFLNSIKTKESFRPFLDLYHGYIEPILITKVADVGFYMEITEAIRSGTKTIILCAGATHTGNIKDALIATYGKEITEIIEEKGAMQHGCVHKDKEEIYQPISEDALIRILGSP